MTRRFNRHFSYLLVICIFVLTSHLEDFHTDETMEYKANHPKKKKDGAHNTSCIYIPGEYAMCQTLLITNFPTTIKLF